MRKLTKNFNNDWLNYRFSTNIRKSEDSQFSKIIWVFVGIAHLMGVVALLKT